jgi:hypothetical protein
MVFLKRVTLISASLRRSFIMAKPGMLPRFANKLAR